MDKKAVEYFLNKHVMVEKISDNSPQDKPFKLYGDLEKIIGDALFLRTDQGVGAILLRDVIRIVEWEDRQ